MSYFDVYPHDGFTYPCTTGSKYADLVAEVGRLHMEVARLEKLVYPLEALRNWVAKQDYVFTPTLCCPGDEVERRITELAALDEIAAVKDKKW